MRTGKRWRLGGLAAAVAMAVMAPLALPGRVAFAADKPLWQVEVSKIPTNPYTRDAKNYVSEATQALRPYLTDGPGDSRVDEVLADVDTRYFDGARLNSAENGEVAYDNVAHLESYLKSRLTGASPPSGEAEQAHIGALVDTLTAARLLADAAIHDAEATIGPFRASPPPAPAPTGLADAFGDLDTARTELRQADSKLTIANPESAAVHASHAWEHAFNVLTRLGITYDGDHDGDGVVDVVELRFGSSPLLVDSDGDGLTDKFEITQLAGWTQPDTPDTDKDGVLDGDEDIDSDGLSNRQEQDLGTSPLKPDTDGDGVNDGTEVAHGSNPLVADQPPAPPLAGDPPPITPVPTATDVDGDGLVDFLETDEYSTDPANPDTDGDGLSDGAEIDSYLTDPRSSDTDGDGLRDDYEIAHADDQGLDPTIPDEQVSKWTYVTDFLLGMFAGDFDIKDSMAWLAGNLCSGGLSFIPVVGWILGGLADLRDTIADVIHADWVGAGLSILGLIPYGGDAVAIPGKAARFVLRYLHRLDPVIRFVSRWNKIPDGIKTATIKLILAGNYGKLTDAGLSEATIIRLARGARTSLPRLADALSDPLHRAGAAAPYLPGGTAGENWFADLMRSEGKFGARPPDTLTNTPLGRRYPDYIEEAADGSDIAHEVKTGVPNYSKDDLLSQCHKDGLLKRSGVFADVVWHFLPFSNGKEESLGMKDFLLACLREEGIPFTVHLPNS